MLKACRDHNIVQFVGACIQVGVAANGPRCAVCLPSMFGGHSSIHNLARATSIVIDWRVYTAAPLRCLSSASSTPAALVLHTAAQLTVCCALSRAALLLPPYQAEHCCGCLALQPTETLLVTEYLEGGDLFQALACESEGKLSWYR